MAGLEHKQLSNTPMITTVDIVNMKTYPNYLYREFFQQYKLKISLEIFDIFNIFAQNIDCGYTLELPQQYPQSMFKIKNKNNCIPL